MPVEIMIKRLLVLLVALILLVSCSSGENDSEPYMDSFVFQYDMLSDTAGVRYLLREHIMGDFNYGLVSYYGVEDIPEGAYPYPEWRGMGYHVLNGVRLDDYDGGVRYSYTYVDPRDRTDPDGIIRHRRIFKDENGLVDCTVGSISLDSHSPGCVLSCISFDDYGEGNRITSFYAGDAEGAASLCILKQYLDGDKDECRLLKIPLSEIGSGVRGLRFINDRAGIMLAGSEDGFEEQPRIYITVDGGKTWNSMDTSQLVYPESFEAYRTCCLEMYGDLIQVRVQCKQKGRQSADEAEIHVLPYTEPFYIISEDRGKTWTGYLRGGDCYFSPHFEEVYGFTAVTPTVEIDLDADGKTLTARLDEFVIPAEEFTVFEP